MITYPPLPPKPKAEAMAMRDYQRRAVANIERCLAENSSTLLVCATGTGKTVMLAHTIKKLLAATDKRAMVLAHREELITQNARTIERVIGEPCDIERADQHADTTLRRAKVIVASKDSLHAKRLARFNPADFGLVITDEAHHAVAGSYGRIYTHFAGVPHLGVTATPDRTDEEALGQVFSTVAMVYDIADAIKDGWLVPVRAHTVIVQGLDLSGIKTTGGDLNQGELAEQLERERPMHEIAASITRECGDRRAIVFTVSVRQAERLAEILNDYRPNAARWICGETPSEKRAEDLRAFREGECQFMVNVGVLTEGFDDPGVSMIVMARPTKSRSLFAQCIGRGTRPLPGLVDRLTTPATRKAAIAASDKPNTKILDFTGNCGRHRLVTPADVLGGKYPDEDRAAAAAFSEFDEDVLERLEAARQDRESGMRELVSMYDGARRRLVAAAHYLLDEADLFDGAFTPGRERTWLGGKKPTENQIATLSRHGFKREDAEMMSKDEAGRLCGEIVSRVHRGLCTVKQVKSLTQRGFKNAKDMTFEEARTHLDRLYGGTR